ncbi:hypothetical protein AB07_4116 [Citrobacter freundii]|nr:hypothetical protein AB07_4116 [Citrobacter freundii]
MTEIMMPNIVSLHAREEDKSGNNAVIPTDVIFFWAFFME